MLFLAPIAGSLLNAAVSGFVAGGTAAYLRKLG